MPLVSVGDLAQSFMLRRQNADLKSQLGTLVDELASGRTADVSRHLSGSYSYLADVERNLRLLEGYNSATAEARLFTDAMQDTLNNFQDLVSNLGLSLMSSGRSGLAQAVDTASHQAKEDFEIMVNALNTDVAGRSLFAGIATDSSPIASATDILDALRTEIAGETTLAGIQAKFDTWFDTPGGDFDTLAYQGDTTSLAPFSLGNGETVDLDLRADHDALRVLLKHATMGALASDGTLAFSPDLKAEILIAAGEGLTFDQHGLTQVRADLGYAQSRVEESGIRISAERTSLQMARSELLAVDPYETVTKLEDVQSQLEGLYTVTARLSRLSLVDYLA